MLGSTASGLTQVAVQRDGYGAMAVPVMVPLGGFGAEYAQPPSSTLTYGGHPALGVSVGPRSAMSVKPMHKWRRGDAIADDTGMGLAEGGHSMPGSPRRPRGTAQGDPALSLLGLLSPRDGGDSVAPGHTPQTRWLQGASPRGGAALPGSPSAQPPGEPDSRDPWGFH
jgi:hypothetical protein